MQITAITSQKRKKDRFNIFVDGTFAFALDADVLIKHSLKLHQTLTADEISTILKDGEFAKWKNKTLEYLSRRPKSKKELTEYLKRKEAGEEIIHLVIADLEKKKLVNDYAFAEWFVEQRKTFRAKGISFIKSELRQKGIAPEIINEVVSQAITPRDEVSIALQFVRKKLKQKVFTPYEVKQKVSQWLSQRGYSWSIISEVLQALKTTSAELT